MSNKIVKFPTESKKEKSSPSVNFGNSLYDMNKQLMEQTGKELTHLELVSKQEKLEDWFNWEVDCYAMLLCHDRRDFTIFHMYENQNPNPPAVAAKECLECLINRGNIYSLDLNEDKAWEIWLKIEDKFYCYYLFCYDRAVIEC